MIRKVLRSFCAAALAFALLVGAADIAPVNAASASIKLNMTKKTLTVGSSTTVKVKTVKGLKSKKVSFKSSNAKIAAVSSKGVVKAKKAGKATITVTSTTNKKVYAKCVITVKEKETAKALEAADFEQAGYEVTYNSAIYASFETARGIKLGTEKSVVEKAYPTSAKAADIGIDISKYDITGHIPCSAAKYTFTIDGTDYQICFVYDQCDKVMAIIY